MRVFGFHDSSACGYYRITLPLDALAAHGWDIQTACGWDNRALDYQVIIGQRIAKTDALPLWRKLYPGRRLVYETDDDMWSIDPTNLRALREHSPSLLDTAAEAIGMAHLVTVTTQPLADVVGQYNRNVAVLPNHVDARMLDLERPRRDRLVIGWAGGDSHMKDIKAVAPQLKRVLRKHPDTEFHNIGTDYTRVFGIPGRATGWKDIWDYYRSIDFDIGIAPLAHLTFNNSKSHIKALEYAALGIPVIASDEPPYRDFVLHGVTGFLVRRRKEEWGEYLAELIGDRGLREEMGAKAKEHAAEFTIQRGWRLWADAYERIMA